jgi:hypothetical protein
MIRHHGSSPVKPRGARSRPAAVRGGGRTIAIPEWEGRVSPLFDVASRLLVGRVGETGRTRWRQESLGTQDVAARARRLAARRIDVVLCGGISRAFHEELERAGVRVIPHISGCVQHVMQAYLDHRLAENCFSMPGCRARCRWCRGRRAYE